MHFSTLSLDAIQTELLTLEISGISRQEGWKALFKGLGPNLAGVVPARYVELTFQQRIASWQTRTD